MEWTPAAAKELVGLVRSCTFDFEKVAQQMRFAVLDMENVALGANVCRMRFTQLQKAKEQQRAMPQNQEVKVRPVIWTPALDALLLEEADRTIYDFDEVANAIGHRLGAGHAVDATTCRLRLAEIDG